MSATRYRRLPGRRRGILGGASVWLGEDHLLAVRSVRFRESYKRFYLRDVQAIAIANKPRFHISMRSLVVGASLFWIYLILRSRWDWVDLAFVGLTLGLVGAWVLVSAAFSCTCRIYTAVSRDELPSIYRTWTARRFLARVEPLITQAQGKLEGDWTEAMEPKGVGPAMPLPPPLDAVEAPRPMLTGAPTQGTVLATDKTAPAFFIATLFLDAGFNLATLNSVSRWAFWTHWLLTLARLAAAVLVFVQRYRRRVRSGMQTLAIISLAITGILFYVQQLTGQLRAAAEGRVYDGVAAAIRLPMVVQADAAISIVLALIALAMVRSGS